MSTSVNITFSANGEVFHNTFSVFIHHLSQILHGGDGVITNTVQDDAWKTENKINYAFILRRLSQDNFHFWLNVLFAILYSQFYRSSERNLNVAIYTTENQ